MPIAEAIFDAYWDEQQDYMFYAQKNFEGMPLRRAYVWGFGNQMRDYLLRSNCRRIRMS